MNALTDMIMEEKEIYLYQIFASIFSIAAIMLRWPANLVQSIFMTLLCVNCLFLVSILHSSQKTNES